MRPRLALIAAPIAVLLLAVLFTVGGVGPFASDDAPAPAAAKPAVNDPTKPDAASSPDGTKPDASSGRAHGPKPTGTPAGANAAEALKAAETAEVAAAGSLEDAVGRKDLPAVERTLVHLIQLQHSMDGEDTSEPARLAERSCAALDTSQPLAKALADTCDDAITITKLTTGVGQKCSTPTAACSSTAAHLAASTKRYVRARGRYARALRAEVAPGVCRKALLPTSAELAGLRGVSLALKHLARAALAENTADMGTATQELQAASLTANTDARPAIAVSEAMRAACQLPRFHESDLN